MYDAILIDAMDQRKIPAGRAAYAIAETLKEAEKAAQTPSSIVEALITGRKRASETLDIQFRWREARNNKSSARGNASVIDTKLDRVVAAIAEKLDGELVGDDDEPEVKAAKKILSALFSDGVAAIIHQSYENQLGDMDAMIARLTTDLADAVETVHLGRHVRRLTRLTEQYREEISTRNEPAVTFDQVEASQDRLHAAICKIKVAILFELDDDEAATQKLRSALMAPMREQEVRVAEAFRRRRRPLDIDPVSGEEVEQDPELSDEPQVEPTGEDREPTEL